MSKKLPRLLSKQVAFNGLSYLLKGGLMHKNGHLPKQDHTISDDFFGVCIASSKSAKYDTYIIKALETLGVNNVRLDFSYEDVDHFNARFLNKLLSKNFNVTLRLIPPYESAKYMFEDAHRQAWQAFLDTVLDAYGTQVKQLEIGNTVNRIKWAAFNINSFLVTWDIAYKAIKARGIKLLGPNVQDFEPVYNIGLLKILKARKQLPDVHTDNLFVERATEPERFDYRILKYQWARKLKYNLIKKAKILQAIGHDFGVAATTSSAAFWAIYRIERRLTHGAEKQADYLTRYFTLLAASGAMQQASWGTLICHREGLINDGLTGDEYPALERIAHYKNADGDLNDYQEYPSFYAMQTVVKYLSGAYYKKTIASAKGLEMHAFDNHGQQIHVVWTINGKLAILSDLYTENSLSTATILHRDGKPVKENQGLVTETPIYLTWDKNTTIETKPNPSLASDVAIDKHITGLQYFHYRQNGWQGVVLAKNQAEANKLLKEIAPDALQTPDKQQALRHARNAIWAIPDPRNKENKQKQLTVKQPVKMYPHKAFLDRFKPSKAKRSWNGAMELLRRGIDSPQPIAYFEKVGDKTLKQNFYLCVYQAADFTIGQIFPAFAAGEPSFHNITPEVFYPQFAQFCNRMHSRGIHFRDFSGGNILVNVQADGTLHFSLIDTARLHTYNYSVPMKLRLADLTRACNKLHWEGREQFMRQYLAIRGKQWSLSTKMPFYLYDFKVKMKRTIGRKAIKKLMKRLKGQ